MHSVLGGEDDQVGELGEFVLVVRHAFEEVRELLGCAVQVESGEVLLLVEQGYGHVVDDVLHDVRDVVGFEELLDLANSPVL